MGVDLGGGLRCVAPVGDVCGEGVLWASSESTVYWTDIADGCLWNCRYGGGCVVRVAPDGNVDRIVELPAENVTTCRLRRPGPRDALHHHR